MVTILIANLGNKTMHHGDPHYDHLLSSRGILNIKAILVKTI